MGEARRRRVAQRPLKYRDLTTGETRQARDGGDVEAYLDSWGRGERPLVPCNGCVTCCYHGNVDVYPDRERSEDLPFMLIEQNERGAWRMRKRPDGACVHLTESGCGIYDHRPQSCRKYDCRLYSLFGVPDAMSDGRHTPMWAFRQGKLRSRVLLTACQMAGMLAAAELKREGKSLTADAVATRGMAKVPELAGAMEAMAKVPRDRWREVFGFDPGAVTPEQSAQLQMEMVRRLGLSDLAHQRVAPMREDE